MQLKHLDYALALDNVSEDGSFAGYASVFDVTDRQKDMIVRGAFARTIIQNRDSIKLLWQHRPDEPIGVLTIIREDARGLYVEGKLLLDVQRGREAYSLLKSGALDGLSIGYNAVDYDIDEESGIRIIKDIDLWEISLVTFPANQEAGVTVVKAADNDSDNCNLITDNSRSLPKTLREFEHFLRDVGFSRAYAKNISLFGFKSVQEREAAGDKEAELERAFDRALRALCDGTI